MAGHGGAGAAYLHARGWELAARLVAGGLRREAEGVGTGVTLSEGGGAGTRVSLREGEGAGTGATPREGAGEGARTRVTLTPACTNSPEQLGSIAGGGSNPLRSLLGTPQFMAPEVIRLVCNIRVYIVCVCVSIYISKIYCVCVCAWLLCVCVCIYIYTYIYLYLYR